MQRFFVAFVKAARIIAIVTAVVLLALILTLIFWPELVSRVVRYTLIGLAAVGLLSLAAVWLNYHRN